MTESRFFRRSAGAATGLTLVALVVDRVMPYPVNAEVPLVEPWLTIVGGVVLWVAILAVSHVGRWVYLIIRGREPNLDD